jgi:hypothetical protein
MSQAKNLHVGLERSSVEQARGIGHRSAPSTTSLTSAASEEAPLGGVDSTDQPIASSHSTIHRWKEREACIFVRQSIRTNDCGSDGASVETRDPIAPRGAVPSAHRSTCVAPTPPCDCLHTCRTAHCLVVHLIGGVRHKREKARRGRFVS